jgi:hypothetical protein
MMQKGIAVPQPQISKPPKGGKQRAKIRETTVALPDFKERKLLYVGDMVKIIKKEGKG